MAKRRIILPDDVKGLLALATELRQMKSDADDHGKRIELLEMAGTQASMIMSTIVEPEPVPAVTMPIIVSHSLIPKEPRPLPKDAAKLRKRPLLPIELPPALHSEVVKIEPFGHSVHDLTESMSRKYMNADQLHAAKKSTRI